MSQQTENMRAFKAGEAIGRNCLVKLNSFNEVVRVGVGEMPIGVTQSDVAMGDNVAVKLLNDGGTFKIMTGASIIAGQLVYAGNLGSIVGTPSGVPLAFAYETASAAGSIIECVLVKIPSTLANLDFEAVPDNKTLDAQDVGKVLYVTTDAKTVTLPATAAGLQYIVMNGGATPGSVGMSVSPNTADRIMGADLAGADNKDRINTKATARPGDYIKLVADGVNGWYVVEENGTWAAEA